MSKFTEEEIKNVFSVVQKNNNFSPATDRSCNGTIFLLNRMETRGVKLIVSRLGKKEELKFSNVADFVDSPCIWIGKNGVGRWAGIQGGWPTEDKEIQEEQEFNRAVIKSDRNRFPNPDIDRPVEFMYLERDKRCYLIPRPGWMDKAKKRIDLYKTLRNKLPEILAAKIAKEIEFGWDGEPKYKQVLTKYGKGGLALLIKAGVVCLAIAKLLDWSFL